eukprot:TRINITY_DN36191_c0_g1_i1.p1 TRINITY_DN36191_c0_g1~~TRINITY_DN36191_c0_g1_i1.p1  ORF type:complete len:727 (-),score=166.86 TRINITY_DN36191_c0_g1_i1:38-2188(-)
MFRASRLVLGQHRWCSTARLAALHGPRPADRHPADASSLSLIAAAAAAATLLATKDKQAECRLPASRVLCEPPPEAEVRLYSAEAEVVGGESIQVPAGEKLVMSADCGGTTTRLMLYSVDSEQPFEPQKPAPGTLLKEVKYPNIAFESLQDIIRTFLHQDCNLPQDVYPTVAVLALAGVVMNNQCRFTNLDWVVNGAELEEQLKIGKVELVNDFVAQGYGMLTLGDDEVTKLNDAPGKPNGAIACIGAGTGLGQCFLVADSDTGEYSCYPSEGQHGEFGPRGAGSDEEQLQMLKYLKIKFSGAGNRISVERVVSGTGICNIYEFLAYAHPHDVDDEVHRQHLERPKDAGVIAANATPGSLCERTLKIFAGAYGAQCGNFALCLQPFGGIYITGGVTKRMASWLLSEGSFMKAYCDKGRLSPLLQKVPLFIVKSDDMGQRGAHYRAVKLLKSEIAKQAHRLFDELDVNRDGLLKASELEGLFQVAGSHLGPHSEQLAKQLLDELDADKDGVVDFQEFLKGFKKVPSKIVSESPFLHSTEGKELYERAQLVKPPTRGTDPDSQADLRQVLADYQMRSRAREVDPYEDRNAAILQSRLWKKKIGADESKEDSWLARQYWINKMGCIIYHSGTQHKALMYCTKKDLANATIERLDQPHSCKQNLFRLHPHPQNGMQLAATEFAAPTKEILECWIKTLQDLQKEAKAELAAGKDELDPSFE